MANYCDELTCQYVAGNPNTPIKVLEQLSHKFPEAVAANPVFCLLILENTNSNFIKICIAETTTLEEKLIELAKDRDWLVRISVARNINTPCDLFFLLAKDQSFLIQNAVAQNPNAPVEILELFAYSKYYSTVRVSVAKNSKTPLYILRILKHDLDVEVRKGVAQNQNSSSDILSSLAKDDADEVRQAVAENPQTPANILENLANDVKYYIRLSVAQNVNTPREILTKLVQDKHDDVRLAVIKNI